VLARASQNVPAHAGGWLAWLGGHTTPHTDTLAQTVTIPSSCRNVTLSFWLDIVTNDPPTRPSDTLTVQVLSSRGSVLATLASYSNLNAGGGYAQHSFSLAAYVGQTVTVRFTAVQTLRGHVTSFFDDDNALNVS
jgi:hypothetical protein